MKPLIKKISRSIKNDEKVEFPRVLGEKELTPLWIPPSDLTKLKDLRKAVDNLFQKKETEKVALIHLSFPRKPLWATRKAYIQEIENRMMKEIPEEYEKEWLKGFERILMKSITTSFHNKIKHDLIDCFTETHKEKVGRISDKVKEYIKTQLKNGRYTFERKIPEKIIQEISADIKKIFFFSCLARIEEKEELIEKLDSFLILLKEAFIPLGWNEEKTFIYINLLK